MTQEEIKDLKEVEFYSASVNAWFNTKLEHDKSLITLSAGAIGLLLTLLTTVGLSSAEALVLYIAAITSFVVVLVTLLMVFRTNGAHIEDVLAGKDSNDPMLTKLDTVALWSFSIGIVFTAFIGIAAAIHSYSSKDKTMANDTTKKTDAAQTVNGIGKFNICIESFDGMAKLQQPQLAARTTSPAASTPAPAASNASQTQSGNTK